MPHGPARPFALNARRHPRSLRRAAAVATAAAAAVALSAAGMQGAEAATRVAFADSVPIWAQHADDSGATSSTTTVEGEAFIDMRNRPQAIALAKAVSTPGTSTYRHFVSAAQFLQTYAPTTDALAATESYLTANGMTIVDSPQSRLYVVFRGTAAQMNAAFQTKLHSYRYEGRKVIAPSVAPSIPAALARTVSGVSLDQGSLLTRSAATTQTASVSAGASGATVGTVLPSGTQGRSGIVDATPNALQTPCSVYAGQHTVGIPKAYGLTKAGTAGCGYTPAQVASASGLGGLDKAGYTGKGQTIAIVGAYASPTIVSDVNTWAAQVKMPALTSATFQQISPSASQFTDQDACGQPSGSQFEQTMDVEAAHGIAPGARILYLGSTDCGAGLDISLSRVLDQKLSTIVSTSYGDPGEALSSDQITNEVNLQMQAVVEGIGLYYASGDNGDEKADLGYSTADFPASSPWVTAVGGTSFTVTSAGRASGLSGWGDTLDAITTGRNGAATGYASALPGKLFAGGSGGGRSSVFGLPWYQASRVPSKVSGGYRAVPDLSALADPYTGYLIGLRPITNDTTLATGAYQRYVGGGTSLATPIVAAEIAVAQQNQNTDFGFLNPTLYTLSLKLPAMFTDVKPTSKSVVVYTDTSASPKTTYLVTLGADSSLSTQSGYDDVTGLGELSFAGLSHLRSGK